MTDKKKVLILADVNSIHTQKWILSLMNDFEIVLFSIDPIFEKNQNIKLIERNVEICTSNIKLANSKNKLLFISQFIKLNKINIRFKPEIIHSHFATSYGLLGRLLKSDCFYISVWGSDIFEFPRKSIFHKTIIKFILSGANKIFSTSNIMALEINKYIKTKIEIIPFGVDADLFKPDNSIKGKKTFVIGTIKSLEKVYGIDRLIEVFEIVSKKIPESICYIYGNGSQESSLKSIVKEKELEEKIIFKGKINNYEVPNRLSEIDIFCALSRSESFGVAVIEASACQKPVIATNIGGLKEVIVNGETGYLMNYDPEKIANKIIDLYSNNDKRKILGENGRNFVMSNFDWTKNVAKMKSFYY